MSNKTIPLLSILCLIVCSSITIASDLGYKPGELLVRFAPKPNGKQRTITERNEILASIEGGNVKRSYKLVSGLTLVKLPTNTAVENALAAFKNASGILYAEPNYRIKAFSTFPNDTRFNEQWGLHNTGQTGGTPDADIDAPEAWDIHTGSSEIIVAAIDTGVDYNHPDLTPNMWVNEAEFNGTPGVDDDGNGYVDDIYGYDFCTWAGKERDSDPMDDSFDGHGTRVAGIIGAVGDNNEGVVGACWNVKIMALKFLDSSSNGKISDAIACIDYAVRMGADIMNNSWGIGNNDSLALRDVIEAADANGVLFVAAAGNDGISHAYNPAGFDLDNIISVMATDSDDNRSIWDPFFEDDDSSNYGADSVDLAAPGSGILSCQPGGDYQYMNGTSMAAPYVAGAAALVWSANPALSHKTVKWIILDTVDVVFDDPNLPKYCVTDGRLNLYNAVFKAGVLPLSKIDDVNNGSSVVPGYDITYTISYGNPFTDLNDPNYIGDINNVVITDYLPDEVDYPDPFDPGYDMLNRTYTWNIGTLSPGEANSVTLTVRVNQLAEPLGIITNVCVIDGDGIRPTTAIETTDVNVWDPGIIYVNKNATVGSNTGMSWQSAYTNLQSAFERAAAGGGSQIWVAAGTYKPTTDPLDYTTTFALIDGVALYGGFAGTETSRSRRNWITNKTVLTGDVDNDGYVDIDYVVTASNVTETAIIDGFTIKKAAWSGIRCENNGSPTIKHNIISENKSKGIDCDNSSPRIVDCNVEDNGSYGIYYSGTFDSNITKCIIKDNGNDGIYNNNSSSATNIINCIIEGNSGDGIYSYSSSSAVIANNIIGGNASYGINGIYDSSTEIKNNWIYNNGYGILIDSYLATVNIRNNTIANNTYYGIRSYSPEEVSITNCIIWGSSPLFTTGYSVTYSCIQDGYIGAGNISNNPGFMNPTDPNDYHLGPNSPCIDAGNTGLITDPNEADIDGEDRVMDGDANGTVIVDMGADEYYWSGVDFNRDGFVNFIDYAQLAVAWQTTPADNDYNDIYDLEDNNFIDYNDLALFCEDWPWQAGWTKTFAAGTDSVLALEAGLYSSSSLSSAASLSVEQLSTET